MSDYIKRDEAMKVMGRFCMMPEAMWALKSIPSIDIVFCKECKNREKYPCNEITFYECSHLRLYGTKVGVEDDWFCADGERSRR